MGESLEQQYFFTLVTVPKESHFSSTRKVNTFISPLPLCGIKLRLQRRGRKYQFHKCIQHCSIFKSIRGEYEIIRRHENYIKKPKVEGGLSNFLRKIHLKSSLISIDFGKVRRKCQEG